jgi:hypothetical protein
MQTKTLPEIAESDLKAARDFLFGEREAGHPAPRRRGNPVRNDVTFRHGIARSRIRAATKLEG